MINKYALAFCALATPAIASAVVTQTHTLTPAGGASYAVDIDNGIAVVGHSQTNAIDIYNAATGTLLHTVAGAGSVGGGVAISGNTIVASAGGTVDIINAGTGQVTGFFSPTVFGDGESVAIDGNIGVLGAENVSDAADEAGAVYVFDTTTGNQLFDLRDAGGQAFDHFGRQVAIGNGFIAASNQIAGSDNSVFVFDASNGQELFEITAPGGSNEFGFNLAIDGGRLAVATAGFGVFVYDLATGSLERSITSVFADSVDLAGDLLVVGNVLDNPETGGSVHAFDLNTGNEIEVFAASGAQSGDIMGHRYVGTDGDSIVVSATGANGFSGVAYLFDAPTVNGSVPMPATIYLTLAGLALLARRRR